NETSVKISRKDPNRVVAAWRDFRQGVNPANRRVGYSYSTDGGISWAVSKLLDSTLLTGFFRNSDPVVGVDTAGNFYIAVISIGSTGALAIYKSTDGGVTFPNAYMIANNGSEDKEYMATDFTPGSPYYNTLYISWTRFSGNSGIKLTKSTNAGVNWTPAVDINDPGNEGQGSDPAVGLNGDVYVTWLGGTATEDYLYFDRSTNGGVSFSTDQIVSIGATPTIPISSSGITFPSIETDISGGVRNGNIYITWCDARNGDADIFISRSTNRGLNWSAPLRVNDDAIGNGKLQCWPWIGVNDSGYISIIFYDARNTTSNTVVEAYLAHSTDGGLTFTNHKLSTQPTPTNQPNTAIRFGDYIGIDYHRNKIVPAWTDERAGGFNMECYTAIVSTPVNIHTISNYRPESFGLKQNYPNPFNPQTIIGYSLTESNDVSVKIYNSLGNEIATLVNQKQSIGSYEVEWNASGHTSGIYFYKLITPNFTETKKMILLK
ncbi:MAG: T9SS type A sorting domain-containing protein, partial [Bacteroidota bacterium]|nr:T9SS type A sorting domain-containing protein [Bacteroidota bacterium]